MTAVSPDTAPVLREAVDLNGLHPFRDCTHNGKAPGRDVCCCSRGEAHPIHDYRPVTITEVDVAYGKPHANRLGCLTALYGDLEKVPCGCEEVPNG